MSLKIKKPLDVFILSLCLIALPLFVFPINLFPGEIIISINGAEQISQAPLSLSYFIGLGYDPSDMENIKDFYLTTRGYALAICMLIGVPFLIAYRVYLKKRKV
tara:strand:- start:2079 stop:2390 length:312 start_codon:yes stop_codon:yes gene_type:complete